MATLRKRRRVVKVFITSAVIVTRCVQIGILLYSAEHDFVLHMYTHKMVIRDVL